MSRTSVSREAVPRRNDDTASRTTAEEMQGCKENTKTVPAFLPGSDASIGSLGGAGRRTNSSMSIADVQ